MVADVRKPLIMGRERKCVTKPSRRTPKTRYMTETSRDTCSSPEQLSVGRQMALKQASNRTDVAAVSQAHNGQADATPEPPLSPHASPNVYVM